MKVFWTKEKILLEAKKHKKSSSFHKTSAYEAAKRMNRKFPGFLSEVLMGMERGNGLTLDIIIKEAKKYPDITSFRNAQPNMYFTYHRLKKKGANVDIFAHMKPKVSDKEIYWTEKNVLEAASKFATAQEMKENSPTAFYALYRLAKKDPTLLDKTNFKKIRPANHWNFVTCQQASKLCKTRQEFRAKYRGAYSAAQRLNFLEKICSHMEDCVILREKFAAEYFFKDLYKNKELLIRREVKIPQRDNEPGRVDFFITIPAFKICLAIEFKHDDSRWTQKELSQQINKYNRAFRERKGFVGTYLVSPKGRYGFSQKEFMLVLETLVSKEEILLPNSLEFIRKQVA